MAQKNQDKVVPRSILKLAHIRKKETRSDQEARGTLRLRPAMRFVLTWCTTSNEPLDLLVTYALTQPNLCHRRAIYWTGSWTKPRRETRPTKPCRRGSSSPTLAAPRPMPLAPCRTTWDGEFR